MGRTRPGQRASLPIIAVFLPPPQARVPTTGHAPVLRSRPDRHLVQRRADGASAGCVRVLSGGCAVARLDHAPPRARDSWHAGERIRVVNSTVKRRSMAGNAGSRVDVDGCAGRTHVVAMLTVPGAPSVELAVATAVFGTPHPDPTRGRDSVPRWYDVRSGSDDAPGLGHPPAAGTIIVGGAPGVPVRSRARAAPRAAQGAATWRSDRRDRFRCVRPRRRGRAHGQRATTHWSAVEDPARPPPGRPRRRRCALHRRRRRRHLGRSGRHPRPVPGAGPPGPRRGRRRSRRPLDGRPSAPHGRAVAAPLGPVRGQTRRYRAPAGWGLRTARPTTLPRRSRADRRHEPADTAPLPRGPGHHSAAVAAHPADPVRPGAPGVDRAPHRADRRAQRAGHPREPCVSSSPEHSACHPSATAVSSAPRGDPHDEGQVRQRPGFAGRDRPPPGSRRSPYGSGQRMAQARPTSARVQCVRAAAARAPRATPGARPSRPGPANGRRAAARAPDRGQARSRATGHASATDLERREPAAAQARDEVGHPSRRRRTRPRACPLRGVALRRLRAWSEHRLGRRTGRIGHRLSGG